MDDGGEWPTLTEAEFYLMAAKKQKGTIRVPRTLTDEMHAAARQTEAGKYLDRLIAEAVARGDTFNPKSEPILQSLWTGMILAYEVGGPR
jgi:hypothetical protein